MENLRDKERRDIERAKKKFLSILESDIGILEKLVESQKQTNRYAGEFEDFDRALGSK